MSDSDDFILIQCYFILMSYLRNRIIQAVVTFYVTVTLAFFFNRLLPGGPVESLQADISQNPQRFGLPEDATVEQINAVVESYLNMPPDKPLHEAYLDYLYSVFIQLDLGNSIVVEPGADVLTLILARAPWTILLSSVGFIYGLVVGILLGSFMAYYEGTKFDIGATVAMILNGAVPYYVAAIILLYFFGFQLGWFPTSGRVDPSLTPGINAEYITSVLHHASLPALSFIVTGFGGSALGLRANSIRLLGEDWIKVARLRGLSTYRISTTYLARNAILPMYTGIVIGLGGLLGGSVIMEEIFAYPGMGLLLFDAVILADYTVLMGVFVITTSLFVLGTLIADFTYALIDPRAEQSSMG